MGSPPVDPDNGTPIGEIEILRFECWPDYFGIPANGCELVQLCREQKPDLIIADVRMPDMDGDVAVQQICRDAPTPFILFSAFSKLAWIPNGIGSIGWVYLTKPVKREDLAKAIEQIFSASIEQG
jgi:YesN/AraC family two-component response regulator